MGENLAENLATNLAENLAEDLADSGGDWRAGEANLTHDWRSGYGETLASGNLDQWTDNVGGLTLSAPSASQRFTPDGAGWAATAANLTYLWTSTLGAFGTTYAGTTPLTSHLRVKLTLTEAYARPWSGASSGALLTSVPVRSTGNFEPSRLPGSILVATSAVTASTHTLTIRYNPADTGSELRAYVDGTEVGTPVNSGTQPVHLWFVMGAATFNGSTFANYVTATLYENLWFSEARSASAIAADHTNLATDWP